MPLGMVFSSRRPSLFCAARGKAESEDLFEFGRRNRIFVELSADYYCKSRRFYARAVCAL